jgi:hypothetical protein
MAKKVPCCAYDLAHHRLTFARGCAWQHGKVKCLVCLGVWVQSLVKWSKQ